MDFSNIDPVALAALVGAVTGVVEMLKRIFDGDYRTAAIIAVAGLTGALLAPYAGDINWFTGLLVGFSASGLVSVATRVGGK